LEPIIVVNDEPVAGWFRVGENNSTGLSKVRNKEHVTLYCCTVITTTLDDLSPLADLQSNDESESQSVDSQALSCICALCENENMIKFLPIIVKLTEPVAGIFVLKTNERRAGSYVTVLLMVPALPNTVNSILALESSPPAYLQCADVSDSHDDA
jgi:hypothetical protein